MNAADAIRGTHRPMRGAEGPHSRQQRLDLARLAAEVAAISADPLERGRSHCPSRVQNSTNTCVDSTNPRMMLTTTPAVNA